MTTPTKPAPATSSTSGADVIPELSRAESEAAFAKLVEEVELTEDDDAAIRARIERMAALDTGDDEDDDG